MMEMCRSLATVNRYLMTFLHHGVSSVTYGLIHRLGCNKCFLSCTMYLLNFIYSTKNVAEVFRWERHMWMPLYDYLIPLPTDILRPLVTSVYSGSTFPMLAWNTFHVCLSTLSTDRKIERINNFLLDWQADKRSSVSCWLFYSPKCDLWTILNSSWYCWPHLSTV